MRSFRPLSLAHWLPILLLPLVVGCLRSDSQPSKPVAAPAVQPLAELPPVKPATAPAAEPSRKPTPTTTAKPEEQLPELRTWSDRSGEFNVKARFVRATDDQIRLRRETGKLSDILIDKLSDADRVYLWSKLEVKYSPQQEIVGRVVGVSDADTLTIQDAAGVNYRIRLYGIDAPENKQPFGDQARKVLREKAHLKNARALWRTKDHDGHYLGEVYVGDRWINKELVDEGCAWHFKKYSMSKILFEAEKAARLAKVGLWASADPMAPWDYRAEQEYLAAHPLVVHQAAVAAPIDKSPPPEPKNEFVRSKPSRSFDDSSSWSSSSYSGSGSGGAKTVHVKGYVRKDGTYVAPHTRAAPGHGSSHRSKR